MSYDDPYMAELERRELDARKAETESHIKSLESELHFLRWVYCNHLSHYQRELAIYDYTGTTGRDKPPVQPVRRP